MPSISKYKPVRSASPDGDERTEALELQEKRHDSDDDQPTDRLLPGNDQAEETWQEIPLSNIKLSRRSAWTVVLLMALASVLVGSLVILIRMFIQNQTDDAAAHSFRRADSEYVLGLDWDFKAPAQVREYNWTIQQIEANPDGVFRTLLTINDMFPGELIRCNEGDTIVVNVENRGVNATAIHFHGLFQNGTNHMDGVPGVTQCPIAPGGRFRYEFTVKGQTGTYFYHAHQAAQALDGLVGPMVIHARDEMETQQTPYASDRVMMVQDWYYDLSSGLLKEKLSPGYEGEPVPDGALINGANKVDCSLHPERRCDSSSAPFASLNFQRNENHRLRIMNVGAFAWFQVTVDQHHDLELIEVDGTTIKPATENHTIIAPGQRYSIVVSAHQPHTDAFWLRARMLKHCFGEFVQPEEGFQEVKAVFRYTTAPALPISTSLPTTENDNAHYAVECKDMATTSYQPLPPKPAPQADTSYYLRVNVEIGDWRLERGFLNTSSFRPNLSSPALHRVISRLSSTPQNTSFLTEGLNTASFDPAHELVISHSSPQTIDLVLQNFDESPHPFHLHGHVLWVLGQGHGYFPGYAALGLRAAPEEKSPVDSGNDTTVLSNPLRRDVATVEGFGWALVRFVADNPGVWFFHCHVAWHDNAGMGMLFVSRTDLLAGWSVPEGNRALCEVDGGELKKGAAPGDEIWIGGG